LLDPLAWIDSEDDAYDEVTNLTDFDIPLVSAAGSSSSVPPTQIDVANEFGLGARLDFVAASGWRVFAVESLTLSRDEIQLMEARRSVHSHNDPVIAGLMPWNSLLSGLELSGRTSDLHQRNAELSPLERSSPLALVATLWTEPSGGRYAPDLESHPLGGATRNTEAAPAPPDWKLYVLDLEQALKASYRDVCQGLTCETTTTNRGQAPRSEPADRVEWLPILPGASAESLGLGHEASQSDGRSESIHAIPAAGDLEAAPASRGDRPSSTELGGGELPAATVPFLSAIVASSLVAGWLWARRSGSPRRRGLRNGFSKDPRVHSS
jgi:hypothetical protein